MIYLGKELTINDFKKIVGKRIKVNEITVDAKSIKGEYIVLEYVEKCGFLDCLINNEKTTYVDKPSVYIQIDNNYGWWIPFTSHIINVDIQLEFSF